MNPYLDLTFLDADQKVTISSDYIINESILFDKKLINNTLAPSSNRVTLGLIKDCAYIERILSTDKDIKAQLYLYDNGKKNVLFTGYLSNNNKWEITTTGMSQLSITLEDIGTKLFKKSFKEEKVLKGTFNQVLNEICKDAGVTVGNIPTIDIQVSCLVTKKDSFEKILKSLVTECLYTYYFDNFGNLLIEHLETKPPMVDDSMHTIDKGSLYEVSNKAIQYSKSLKQKGLINLKWKELKTRRGYVYKDVSGREAGYPDCKILLKSGMYYPPTDKPEDVYTVEVTDVDEGQDIVYIENLQPLEFEYRLSKITAEFKQVENLKLAVKCHNVGSADGLITKLQAQADITYSINNETEAGDAEYDKQEVEAIFIHDKTNADNYAQFLASFNKYCNASYTFYSNRDLKLGDVYNLKDDIFSGLNVNLLLTEKKYKLDGLYSYKGIAVTNFQISPIINNSSVHKPSRALNGIPGSDGKSTYFHIKYADTMPPIEPQTRMLRAATPDFEMTDTPSKYIGTQTSFDSTPSSDYRDYTWAQFQGNDGKGIKGDNAYLHIAYSNSADGSKDFSTTDSLNKAYMGQYADSIEEDSKNYLDYRWSKIAGPKGDDGKPVASISLAVDKTQINYYADNVPVNPNEVIKVSVMELGIGKDIELTWGESGHATILSPSGTYNVPIHNLDDAETLTITAICGEYTNSISVAKHYEYGELILKTDHQNVNFYADDVPHNAEDKINITFESRGFSQNPEFIVDGKKVTLSSPKKGAYQVPASLFVGKPYITVLYKNSIIEKGISLTKHMDTGVLTITSDKDTFTYYADNIITNTADSITLNIAQSGFSRMPDLYLDNVKTSYTGSTYVLRPEVIQNKTSLNCRIAIKDFKAERIIRKSFETPSIFINLDSSIIEFTVDNVPLIESTKARVTYNGLHYLPKLFIDDIETPLSEDGIATIPANLLSNKSVIVLRAVPSRTVTMETRALVTKQVVDLNLSLDIDSTQFSYDKDGNVSPSSVTVTNTTTGLNDISKVVLMVGKEAKQWNADNTFTITPAMIPEKYTVVTISYGKKTASAIVINTYDGQDGQPGKDGEPGKDGSPGIQGPIGPGGPAGPKGENAGGVYLGSSKTDPSTRPDGSKIEDGDYYLNVNNPANPLPYRKKGGKWLLVTESDKDWSKIASDTMGDVTKWNGEILSTSAYYGYFTMLAAQKAFINELSSNKIVLNKEGEIVSSNYESSGGTEGFRLSANGDVDFNNGTWRGSFANGLVFNAPTHCEVKKTMTQKEAYKILKEAGIGAGVYNSNDYSVAKFQRKDFSLNDPIMPLRSYQYASFSCLDYDPAEVDSNIPISLFRSINSYRYDPGIPGESYKTGMIGESIFGPLAMVIPFSFNTFILVLMKENRNVNPPYELRGFYILKKEGIEKLINNMASTVSDIYPLYSSNPEQYYQAMINYVGLIQIPELNNAISSLSNEMHLFIYPAVTKNGSYLFYDCKDGSGVKGISTELDSNGTYHAFNCSFSGFQNNRANIAQAAPLNNIYVDGNTIKVCAYGKNGSGINEKATLKATLNTPNISSITFTKELTISETLRDRVYEATTVNNKLFALVLGDDGRFIYFAEITNGTIRPIPSDIVKWDTLKSEYIDGRWEYFPNDKLRMSNLFVKNGWIYGSINGSTFRYDVANDKYYDMTVDLGQVFFAEGTTEGRFEDADRTSIMGTQLEWDKNSYDPRYMHYTSTASVTSITWDNKENAIFFNYKCPVNPRTDRYSNNENANRDKSSDLYICSPIYYHQEDNTFKVFATPTTQNVLAQTPYGKFSLISDANRRVYASDSGVIFFNGVNIRNTISHFINYPIREIYTRLPGFGENVGLCTYVSSSLISILDDFRMSGRFWLYYITYFSGVDKTMRVMDKGLDSRGYLIPSDEFDFGSVFPFFSRRIVVREDKDSLKLIVPIIIDAYAMGSGDARFVSEAMVTAEGQRGMIVCDEMEPFLIINKNSNEPVGASFIWNFPAQLTTIEKIGPVVNSLSKSWDMIDAKFLQGSGGSGPSPAEIKAIAKEAAKDEATIVATNKVEEMLGPVGTALDNTNGEVIP